MYHSTASDEMLKCKKKNNLKFIGGTNYFGEFETDVFEIQITK
jgi:hypothetical protein